MYWFKETKKAELLSGRTITYLAEKKLSCNVCYLSQILKGRAGCSKRFAEDICRCICLEAKLEDYFYTK